MPKATPDSPRTIPVFRFAPGDAVPVSGLYLVMHADHRETHQAMLLSGETFPACRGCHDQVRFSLIRDTEALAEDPDFAGGAAEPARRAA